MQPYYQDDAVTLWHGDNREIFPAVAGPFDLLLTDPPFGLGMARQLWTGQRGKIEKKSWDDQTPDARTLGSFMLSATAHCIWGGNYFNLPASRGWLAWCKPDAPPSMGNVELAWTSKDMNCRYIHHSIAATNAERLGHPTQKPLRVIKWALGFFPDAQTIFDPYAGTGTTGRAAKDAGKKCMMIEGDESYCEIIARRMQQEVLSL